MLYCPPNPWGAVDHDDPGYVETLFRNSRRSTETTTAASATTTPASANEARRQKYDRDNHALNASPKANPRLDCNHSKKLRIHRQ
jgi:hypothetical protein